jgi:putative FmdB family regulatory protein
VPTYQYACTECGDRLEVVQKFSDDSLTVCPACSGRLRKVFSPVGIVFKGSGFYRNDSRKGPDVKTKAMNGSDANSAKDGKAAAGASGSGGSGADNGSSSGDKAPTAASSGSSSSSSGSSGSSGSAGSSGSGTSGSSSASSGSKVA